MSTMIPVFVVSGIATLATIGVIIIFFYPTWWLGWAFAGPVVLCGLAVLIAGLMTFGTFIVNKIRSGARVVK